jgi:hypothetical protein
MELTWGIASPEWVYNSQSRLCRRYRPSQANVRSTTQRRGSFKNPTDSRLLTLPHPRLIDRPHGLAASIGDSPEIRLQFIRAESRIRGRVSSTDQMVSQEVFR